MKSRLITWRSVWILGALAIMLIVATALAVVVQMGKTPPAATPDDWSIYLHDPQRTSASNDTILSPSNITRLTKHWTYSTKGTIEGAAAVFNGVAYIGSWDGYEYALDAKTGALKWKTFLGIVNVPNCFPPKLGVSSGADVEGNVVYLGGGDDDWYALNANTGAVLWKVYVGDSSATGGNYNWASPLIYNGYAYIGVASVGDCPLVQGELLKVSLQTHAIVKKLNIVPDGQVGGGIWTTPSLDPATNTIYLSTATANIITQKWAQALLAVDASTLDVKSYWTLPNAAAVVDSDFATTPTLFSDAAGDPLVISVNKNGVAYVFDRRKSLSAGPIWQQRIALGGESPTQGSASVSSGTVGGGRLYIAGGNTPVNGVGYQGAIRALDPGTGKILWQDGVPGIVIGALVYDNGLVIASAGDTILLLDAASGKRLYSYQLDSDMYVSPTVADGQIFTGSLNGTIYALDLSNSTPTAPADAHCPDGWTCQDVGGPAPAGAETFSQNKWSVNAGGAGLTGSKDEFRLMTRPATGNVQVKAQVAFQQGTSLSAQAGVMIRQNADADSPYYGVFVTADNKVIVQYRTAFGGDTTIANTLLNGAPRALEVVRSGDLFQAAISTDGTTYTLVPGTDVTMMLPAKVLAGLAVSAHTSGTSVTATYQNVSVGAPASMPIPMPPATSCPANWSCDDVGNPILVGDQSLQADQWTVQGSGQDITDYADQFHFVWQSLSGDGTISARIFAQSATDPSAKAGVMIRQNASGNSAFYGVFVTPGNGVMVLYRTVQGLKTIPIATSIDSTTPVYVQVARSGDTFTTYTSADGTTWTPVIGTSIDLNWNGPLLAGLAVTAHNTSVVGAASFSAVTLTISAPSAPNGCPANWNCQDIGYPNLGSQLFLNGNWTLQAGGGDIWNVADQFRYVWQSLPGDGDISARVTSQSVSDENAKAGVMIRASDDSQSAYYGVFVTPGNGIVVQYRPTQGATTTSLVTIPGKTPTYLKVQRTGDTFTAYTSSNGVTWNLIAGSSMTLTLTGSLMEGMAVTAHNGDALSTVTFTDVKIG